MACSCICAPGLLAEKPRLEALGGDWLGCCGDPNHTYGFHLPSCACAEDDYSLRYGRGNENWACAMDLGMGWPGSREWLARLVAAVRAGQYSPVVEIIGSLDGREVLYWARWNNWRTEKYTGAGHDTWTHVSYDRMQAGTDLHLLDGDLMALNAVETQRDIANTMRIEAQSKGFEKIQTAWNAIKVDEPQWLVKQVKAIAEGHEEQAAKLASVEAKLDEILALLKGGATTTFPVAGSITYQVIP